MDLHTFEELRPRLRFMQDIAAEVADRHGVTVDELISPGRTARLARARFEAFWICREQRLSTGARRWSYPAIGRFFGKRDHTTVLHGCSRYEELRALREAAE